MPGPVLQVCCRSSQADPILAHPCPSVIACARFLDSVVIRSCKLTHICRLPCVHLICVFLGSCGEQAVCRKKCDGLNSCSSVQDTRNLCTASCAATQKSSDSHRDGRWPAILGAVAKWSGRTNPPKDGHKLPAGAEKSFSSTHG